MVAKHLYIASVVINSEIEFPATPNVLQTTHFDEEMNFLPEIDVLPSDPFSISNVMHEVQNFIYCCEAHIFQSYTHSLL